MRLVYKSVEEGVKLEGVTDDDYSGNRDNRKSTSSYIFTLCELEALTQTYSCFMYH